MALVHNVNVAATSGDQCMYLLITTLIAAGWTVPSSSDSSTYNASGNQITGSGSGANGLGNANAWVRLQDPDGLREYVIQRGTTGAAWRITYSAAAKHTGGTPGLARVPTASDGQIIAGSGSDVSPITANILTASPTGRVHVVTTDTPENGVYWWWFANNTATTQATAFALACDAMESGSNHVDDTDPCAHFMPNAGGATTPGTFSATWKYWVKYGLIGAVFNTDGGPALLVNNSSPVFGVGSAGNTNPYTGEDEVFRAPFVAALGSKKGDSHIVRYSSIYRQYPATWNLADANKSSVRIGGVLLRWPTGVAPVS